MDTIATANIVVADDNTIITVEDTIIDDSGLTDIFNNEIFYNITETEKRLPNKDIQSRYLKYEYLDVEIIDLEELI